MCASLREYVPMLIKEKPLSRNSPTRDVPKRKSPRMTLFLRAASTRLCVAALAAVRELFGSLMRVLWLRCFVLSLTTLHGLVGFLQFQSDNRNLGCA